MQITNLECLHADAGFRNFDFLKVSTSDGVVGWSEYNESFGGLGLTSVIEKLAPIVMGQDARAYEAIVARLYTARRQAAGGITQQAIGAIENALLDAKAKALGIPVYEMLGGPLRERIRLYWSHCGTYRVEWPEVLELPPVRSLDDVVALGKEVVDRGYTALKTNIFMLGDNPSVYFPGFGQDTEHPQLNPDRRVIQGLVDQVAALRQGAGPEIDILVDLNFNFKTEGFLEVARALEPHDLMWLELDTYNPDALATIRRGTTIPIASGESLYRRRDYRPYFEAQAMDVAIIDTPWNGVGEGLKIASLADVHEVNVAPHNFYGNLSTMMNAHFCAVVPNFRIMEIDVDEVPWHHDLFTVSPQIVDGHLILPTGPGWGTEINEEAVRDHPPRHDGEIFD